MLRKTLLTLLGVAVLTVATHAGSGLKVRLRILIAVAENAVGPASYRPGDVIATRRGLTVEVGDTDAEGRLVLADALTAASETDPALILDFATLTGAARARPPSVPASAAASASSPAASTTRSPPAVKCRATALPMFPASMIAVVIGCPPFVAGPGKWLAWSLPPGGCLPTPAIPGA